MEIEIPRTIEQWNAAGGDYLPGLLGLTFVKVEPQEVVARLMARKALGAWNGYLHAGAVVTLADTCCGYGTVRSLPEGLHTPIGERGSRLSGGQRQRVGIARALYKQAEVLLLDEATSALDNETEREVSEAINKLSHTSITIFIIAHRLTTLQDCDRIFELKDGRIHAEYTYERLMQQHGIAHGSVEHPV